MSRLEEQIMALPEADFKRLYDIFTVGCSENEGRLFLLQ